MTIASVVAEVRGEGVHRVFASTATRASAVLEALAAAGLEIVEAPDASTAVLLAAIAGDLEDVPAAVVLAAGDRAGAAAALAYARDERAPLVVVSEDSRAIEGWPAPARALPAVDASALDQAAVCLVAASRPVVLAGLGCRRDDGAAWLRPFAEALPAPVLTTLKAKAALPDPHPLAFGVLGPSGVPATLAARADLIVTLGLDPVEPACRWLPSGRPALALAPAGDAATSPAEGGLAVPGTVAQVLEELALRIRGGGRADWDIAELDRLKRLGAGAGQPADGLSPWRAARIAREMVPAGAIAALDPGPHADAVTRAWQAVGPREFVTPMGAAPPAFAPTAAAAARLVRPDAPAIAFAAGLAVGGAGPVLAFARRHGLAVTVIAFGSPPGMAPDVPVQPVTTEAELVAALAAALAGRGPALIIVPPV